MIMIEEMVDYVQVTLHNYVMIICLSVAGIIAAMAIDLAVGIAKARINGVARTSEGIRRTAAKAAKYLLPAFVLIWVDLLGSAVMASPYFIMIWSAYCIVCEWWSVMEKSWQKAELRKAEKTMTVVVENKEDIAKMALELYKQMLERYGKEDNAEGDTQ